VFDIDRQGIVRFSAELKRSLHKFPAMSFGPASSTTGSERLLSTDDLDIPLLEKGIGSVITRPNSPHLLDGVRIDSVAIWPDDRGHFMEVQRLGRGLATLFPPSTTQVSATVTYANVVKAFHYHFRQYDCWTVVKGMLQVALIDLRRQSSTFGQRNTLYVGETRPWQVLIPPGIAHGYKVIGRDSSVLVYVTSQFYDPTDECRIAFDDQRLAYDWETQFK
jgi:dTDP-4-dehydrorhamnose 3,5-epimerase